MSRRTGASLAVVLALATPAAAATPPLDLFAPTPALRSTAHRAIAAGLGAHRVALWTATNSRAELCVAWAAGAATTPGRFTCLRHGLERPLLTVEYGGGLGGVGTWGTIVGLVAPPVTRVSAETQFGSQTVRDLALRTVPWLPGWHAFATGPLDHPTSTTLKAYDTGGNLVVDSSGAGIHPSAPPASGGKLPVIVVSPPGQPPSGPAWSDTATTLGETSAQERAISVVLADSILRPLVATHAAWVESGGPWFACNGRQLGSVLTLRFASPVAFTANLPAVFRPAGASAYAVSVRTIAVSGARELMIWVDTNLAQVVGVNADWWPMVPGPGPATLLGTISPPHDQGGVDTPNCWQSSG